MRVRRGHERPGPLAPPPLQGLRSYYEPVRQHGPRRYSSPPATAAARDAPSRRPQGGQCRAVPSHVPRESRRSGSRRLHAGHRLASQRASARLIPGSSGHPGFDVVCFYFDTSAAIRLRSPSRSPPDASSGAFSTSLTTVGIQPPQHVAVWGLPPQGDSEGPEPSSSTQHRLTKLYLHRAPFGVRDTPTRRSTDD
jgi:hypothetical protein